MEKHSNHSHTPPPQRPRAYVRVSSLGVRETNANRTGSTVAHVPSCVIGSSARERKIIQPVIWPKVLGEPLVSYPM